MFPINRLRAYFDTLQHPSTIWLKVADGEYVAEALGLILTIRRQPNGRFKWAIVKESSGDFETAEAAAINLVTQLSRSGGSIQPELPDH